MLNKIDDLLEKVDEKKKHSFILNKLENIIKSFDVSDYKNDKTIKSCLEEVKQDILSNKKHSILKKKLLKIQELIEINNLNLSKQDELLLNH